MYESPITKYMRDIETQIREAEDKQLMYEIKQAIGFAVDKQELIKALEYDRGQYNKGYEDGLNADKWIPVSERLPEKNMRCLVAVGRFNFTQIAVYSDLMGTIDRQIFYQGDVGHDNFMNITQYVKAWMPLPQPYKAESEDKAWID